MDWSVEMNWSPRQRVLLYHLPNKLLLDIVAYLDFSSVRLLSQSHPDFRNVLRPRLPSARLHWYKHLVRENQTATLGTHVCWRCLGMSSTSEHSQETRYTSEFYGGPRYTLCYCCIHKSKPAQPIPTAWYDFLELGDYCNWCERRYNNRKPHIGGLCPSCSVWMGLHILPDAFIGGLSLALLYLIVVSKFKVGGWRAPSTAEYSSALVEIAGPKWWT